MKLDLGNKLVTTLSVTGQTTTAGTVTGTGVDRRGYEFGAMLLTAGFTMGSPTAMTVTCTVEDSADNSTFAAYGTSSVCITATNVLKRINLDLNSARRYIRPSMVAVFDGGTAPSVYVKAITVLDAFRVLPKADTTQTT
jgi:hypothetical protein